MNDETRRALNAVYEVFSRYKAPRYLVRAPGVPHDARALSRDNLYQLDKDNDLRLTFYSYPDAKILRHFLPRWLELLSEDEEYNKHWLFWDYDLGSQLQYANWKDWPASEVAALREVFLAWTREETQKYDGQPPLRFLQNIDEDIAPHLEIWLGANLPGLTEMLWAVNWSDEPNLLHWVVSSRLESEMEATFFATPDGPNAELFSRSVELVRSLRAFEDE